jgi:hypothetical protein
MRSAAKVGGDGWRLASSISQLAESGTPHCGAGEGPTYLQLCLMLHYRTKQGTMTLKAAIVSLRVFAALTRSDVVEGQAGSHVAVRSLKF